MELKAEQFYGVCRSSAKPLSSAAFCPSIALLAAAPAVPLDCAAWDTHRSYCTACQAVPSERGYHLRHRQDIEREKQSLTFSGNFVAHSEKPQLVQTTLEQLSPYKGWRFYFPTEGVLPHQNIAHGSVFM